jgi:uncharacterized protein YbjT (DUF2867 family)
MKNRFVFVLSASIVMALSACDRTDSVESPEPAAEMQPKVILVTGATGTQGGAVSRELLERGYQVRALTRNPDNSKARALTALGAQLVKGDFNDAQSIAAAMDGVYGVFVVTLFWTDGYDGEVTQGKRLIDAAVEAGVEHIVLTSVAGADESTGIPHFDSKWEVEQYLHQSGANWSIVRPVEFMNNWLWSVEQFKSGHVADPRSSDSSHQWVAASDIGFFVAEAFDNPGQWIGHTLEIAGDQLTVGQFAGLLSEVFSTDITHKQITWDDFEADAGNEMTVMYRWFENDGYSVDITVLRERYPDLVTARDFLTELAARAGEPESAR